MRRYLGIMSHNTWIHRIVRVAVRPLARTAVTPNQVTTVRLIVGLAAVAALAQGGTLWLTLGAGIFVLSLLLDRADGELARLSGKTSPWGHSYDLVSDALCNALAFVGLGVGLARGGAGDWMIALGLLAGTAITAILWLVMLVERQAGQRSAELQGAAGFDPDDAMLVLPLAVWLGAGDWLIMASAVGAPVFAVYMFVKFRRTLAAKAG